MTDDLDRNEPLDSDQNAPGARLISIPLLLVIGGGIIGTALRILLSTAIPDINGVPVGIFTINMIGAFALGLLLETLARRGPDTGSRQRLRLLVGTGVIGGFTTYSALATDTALLVSTDRLIAAGAYSLGTVLLGAIASYVGILTGRLMPKRAGA